MDEAAATVKCRRLSTSNEVPEANWPDALAHEVRRICLCPVIERESVSVSTDHQQITCAYSFACGLILLLNRCKHQFAT